MRENLDVYSYNEGFNDAVDIHINNINYIRKQRIEAIKHFIEYVYYMADIKEIESLNTNCDLYKMLIKMANKIERGKTVSL